jgi:CHASE1-domain containing sensor protein
LVEKQDSLSSNPPMFTEGQTIDVLYEPANPENARIKKWMSLYFLPLLLGGMGLIFGGIGVVLLIFRLLDSLNI